jgi:hypothetical protein
MLNIFKRWFRQPETPFQPTPAAQDLAQPAPAFDWHEGVALGDTPRLTTKTITAKLVNNSNLINAEVVNLLPQPARNSTNTLPAQKAFVGRHDLLRELEQGFRAATNRINITSLKGVGGVGKSALALESGHRFAALFPAGQYWLDLRGSDPGFVMRNFARTLGIVNEEQLKGGLPVLCDLVRDLLHQKKVLLVLDNADGIEHNALRQMCLPKPAVNLITSRADIADTQIIKVDRLSENDALDLLRLELGDNQVNQPLAEAKALITRLGGLALALKITARRMRLFGQSFGQALADLQQSGAAIQKLKLARHHNLDDNIQDSFALTYEPLDAELRHAFHTLGLGHQTGLLQQSFAPLLDCPKETAEDLVIALQRLSLVECINGRLECHPLLHEYAHLCAQREATQYQAMYLRFVRYFGDEIGGAYQRAIGSNDPMPALQRIDAEFDNVELAQTRVLASTFPDAALALEITDNLEGYWRLRDYDLDQLLGWLKTAFQLPQKTNQGHRQANVLKAIGDVQAFRDEREAALASYAKAQQLFEQVGAKLGQANVLQAIGDVQAFRDEREAALASYAKAQQLFEQVGDKLGQANVM